MQHPVEFRGKEYPAHFRFFPEFSNGNAPKTGDIVGNAPNVYDAKLGVFFDRQPFCVLMWIVNELGDGDVVAISTKRYREVYQKK